ncbi:hypothetical protein GCM10009566_42790 [Streptomyces murinus]
MTTGPGRVEALAEEAVVAACTLADAADPSRWSAGAVEDVAAAFAQLDPECSEVLCVVPVAAAAVVERTEQAAAGASESAGGRATAVTSAALHQALAAHGLTRARVHQLGAALVTVTLDAPEAQALAVFLSRRDALPRQAQPGGRGWVGSRAGGICGGRARRRSPHPRQGRIRTSPCLRPGERRPHPTDRTDGGWGPHRPARRGLAQHPPRARAGFQGHRLTLTGHLPLRLRDKFMQVSDVRRPDVTGHGIDWSLPGHLI